MKYLFNFPDIGEGLEEGTVLEWYVQTGQTVKAGDLLVKMETDKVAADIPSPKAGTILKLFGGVGDVIHVGHPLVEMKVAGTAGKGDDLVAETSEENAIEEDNAAGVVGTMEMADAHALLPASDEIVSATSTVNTAGKSFATPHVRAMARELDLDINQIAGTGPGGRVSREDIEQYVSTKSPVEKTVFAQSYEQADVSYEPLSQIRKTIARNMINSKHNAAHVTVFEEVEISELIAIREKYKKKYAERDARLTYLPFIVKATVLALKQHRILNSQMDMENNRMIYKNRYNIGIAMDTPEGLVVPVIKDADRLSVFEITQKITEFGLKAKERKLTLEDMKDGTFTVTNFGSISGIYGTPVINYPQAGILGIGRIVKQPVVKDDQIVIGNVLGLSLTVDHRIVDGGDTARFVKQIIDHLADPVSLLME
jgi:pyruvate dehydrogenase E2 component (dihydrolipoamide acetyltransferase)